MTRETAANDVAATAARVTLREITADTVLDVVQLETAEAQRRYVAPNAVSLAQALFAPEAWYRAIYCGDTLVGFVMLEDESQRSPPPAEPEVALWRLMIDRRHQRRGLGRAAVACVIDHVRRKGGFRQLLVSVVPGEAGPLPFYRALGFVPLGEGDDGELLLARALDEGGTAPEATRG